MNNNKARKAIVTEQIETIRTGQEMIQSMTTLQVIWYCNLFFSNTKIFSIIYVFETPVPKYKFWQKYIIFHSDDGDMFMDI